MWPSHTMTACSDVCSESLVWARPALGAGVSTENPPEADCAVGEAADQEKR